MFISCIDLNQGLLSLGYSKVVAGILALRPLGSGLRQWKVTKKPCGCLGGGFDFRCFLTSIKELQGRCDNRTQ